MTNIYDSPIIHQLFILKTDTKLLEFFANLHFQVFHPSSFRLVIDTEKEGALRGAMN